MGVIQKIIRKLAKRGFTLVEALIATILVGSCIMPIVGTMQNAANMTQHMVDDSKLQMLARSRMNLETSRANNEQKNVDITTTYCYDYYKIVGDEKTINSVQTTASPKIFIDDPSWFGSVKPADFETFVNEYLVKAYSVEVEVRDDVTLFSGDAAEKKEEKGFNGLKQVVVTARVIAVSGDAFCGEDGKILDSRKEDSQSYSLVSLITVPAVSTEYIWALDSTGKKVLALDPLTGLTALSYSLDKYCKTTVFGGEEKEELKTIDYPFSSVLVKPDGKNLLLVGAVQVYTSNWEFYCGNFCVDPKNSKCGCFTSADFGVLEARYDSYSSVVSSALRQDGKVAYLTNGKCISAVTLDWDSKTSLRKSGNNLISSSSGITYRNLKAGYDGYLYYIEDEGSISCLRGISMYGDGSSKMAAVTGIKDYALSPDGQKVYTLATYGLTSKKIDQYKLRIYAKELSTSYEENELKNANEIDCSHMSCSADGKYLIIYDKGVGSKRAKAYFYEIGSDKNIFNSNSSSDNEKLMKSIEFSESPVGGSSKKLIYAPVTNMLAADCNNNRLNLIDFAEFKNNVIEGKNNNATNTTEINARTITDISARNPEYLYVAVKEGTDSKPIYKVKTLDIASGSYIDDLEFEFAKKPLQLILTPSGDRLMVLTEPTSGKTVNQLFVIDLIRNEISDPRDGGFVTDKYFFLDQTTPSNEPIICFYGSSGTQFHKIKYNSELVLLHNFSSAIKVIQLKDGSILHYSSNGLYHYEKPTVTDTNLTIGSELIHYRSPTFPPSNATDMAVSYDDRIIAFKCDNKIKFYDLKTFDFGDKTKINGKALIDVREKSHGLYLGKVPNNKAEYSMLKNDGAYSSLESKIFTNSFEQKDLGYDRRIIGYTDINDTYHMKAVNVRPIRSYYDLVLRNYDYFFHTTAGALKVLQLDLAGEGKVCVDKFAAAKTSELGEDLKNYGWKSMYDGAVKLKSNYVANIFKVDQTKHSDSIVNIMGYSLPPDTTMHNAYGTVKKEIFTYHCYLKPLELNSTRGWFKKSKEAFNEWIKSKRKYKYMEFEHDVGANSNVHVDLYFYPSFYVSNEEKRNFSIEIEGKRVEPLFNAYKLVGNKLYVPIVKSYDTIVGSDGKLNIKFRNMTKEENAMVSAIKLTYWKSNGNTLKNDEKGGLYNSSDAKLTSLYPFKFEPIFMCEYDCSSLEDNRIEFEDDGEPVLVNYMQNYSSSPKYEIEKFYPLNTIVGNPVISENNKRILSKSPFTNDFIVCDNNDKKYKRGSETIAAYTETILKAANKTTQSLYVKSAPNLTPVADLPFVVVNSNKAVVASGGIYIVDWNNNNIYTYNPKGDFDKIVSEKTIKTSFKNTGKNFGTGGASVGNSPIAVYDNNIYGFSYGGKDVYKYDIEKNIVTGSVAAHDELVATPLIVSPSTVDETSTGLVDLSPRIIDGYAEDEIFDSATNMGTQRFYEYEDYDEVNNKLEYHPACTIKFDAGNDYPLSSYYAYCAFDNNSGYGLKFGYKKDVMRYVQIEYDEPVRITKLELHISNCHKATGKKLIAGNTEEALTQKLIIGSDTDEHLLLSSFSKTNIGSNAHSYSYSFDNTNEYKIYKISFTSSSDGNSNICLPEIKLYGYTNHTTEIMPGYTINIPESGMTTVMDDNLKSGNVTNGAACVTPYGIMLAGGNGTTGTSTALLYWPHAVADYDAVSQTQREGIFRSLPNMTIEDGGTKKDVSMKYCSMCWHKGKAYVFGDGTYSGSSKCSLMIYDPANNSWTNGIDIDRKNAAVVSFGDYIYIIGGETLNGSACPKISKYPPGGSLSDLSDVCDLPYEDTAKTKKLSKNISAVAYGSSIYLIGGKLSDNNPSTKIYRFTP